MKTRDDQQLQLVPYYHISRKITPWSWQRQEFRPHRTQYHAGPSPRRMDAGNLGGRSRRCNWRGLLSYLDGGQVSLHGAEGKSWSQWVTPSSVPHSRSVQSDLNGVGTYTGNIWRTFVFWDRVTQFSIVFRDLPTSGRWSVLSFRIWSFKFFEFNRRGGGKGRSNALLPYRRNAFIHSYWTFI